MKSAAGTKPSVSEYEYSYVGVTPDGTPVTVLDIASGRKLVEGVDYAEIPKATGVWPGPWVKPPFGIVPLRGGSLKEGDEIAVNCYCSFPVWGKWVSACMAAPELEPIVERSAAKIVELVNPKLWCLSFDEVRAGGGCQDCRKVGDMAHIYAAFVKKCMGIVRKHRPDVKISYYAYNATQDPPRRVRPADGLVLGIVPVDFRWDSITNYVGAWKRAGLRNFFCRPNRHCYYECPWIPLGNQKHFFKLWYVKYKYFL